MESFESIQYRRDRSPRGRRPSASERRVLREISGDAERSEPIKKAQYSILEPLVFFDLFDQPLRERELIHYISGPPLSLSFVRRAVRQSPLFETRGEYVFLQGRQSLVIKRQERERLAEELWRRAFRFQRLFRRLPFLRMVAVCNSLALGTVSEKSDIDLFVVTCKNRLFFARTIMTLATHLLRIRRHGTRIAGRFCLSFFVSEDGVDLSSIILEDDVYARHWIRSLRPVYGAAFLPQLARANRAWADMYAVSSREYTNNSSGMRNAIPFSRRMLERLFRGRLGDIVENALQAWQIPRARKKAARIPSRLPRAAFVTPRMLKFHDRDIREEVRRRFVSSLAQHRRSRLLRSLRARPLASRASVATYRAPLSSK